MSVAGILIVLDPLASRIAVARLVNPLGNTAWPRTTHLMVRQPVERVARGRAFEIEVVDAQGARLPPEVRIHYRFAGPDGAAVEETDRMRYVDGAMAARRENVLRPFSYRVEGGDDQSMPWCDVQVVEPPAVESVSVRLIPPAYTGWPPAPPNGTSGRWWAPARKSPAGPPSRSVGRCCAWKAGRRFPRTRRRRLHVHRRFPIEKSGSYWFELTDRDGLSGGSDDRWEIHAVPDAPPTVSIEQPTANLFVTPRAVVPLRVVAKDDLAVRDIALVFRQAESELEETLPLWASHGRRPYPLLDDEGTEEGDRRTVDYRWDLGPLKLEPGTQVTFYAMATDYRPQTGKSDPRSLTVITPEELQDRIAGREKLILAELERALRIQRGCRAQVESLLARLASGVGSVRPRSTNSKPSSTTSLKRARYCTDQPWGIGPAQTREPVIR